MEESFHYYATYCAAYLAGYSHDESMDICYSAQFVDLCSRTLLAKIGGPDSAATTQLQLELMDAKTNKTGLQDITRIWSSFHFLPRDLMAEPPRRTSKKFKDKYRLICGPNGDLLVDTVELAKGSSLQAAGIAMHVLADTWAHTYFAGTPSMVINNTGYEFYEIMPENGKMVERHLTFRHSASSPDDLEKGKYTNTLFQTSENTIMNLGHGRAGHLPDYSFMRWRYMPSWGNYEEIIKDNPSDYLHAFTQMVYALRYIRGDIPAFAKETYDIETVLPWAEKIKKILVKRQLNANADWKALGEEMSGCEVEKFDLDKYQAEFMNASQADRDETFIGKFILAALAHKAMVTNRIYSTGNKLAGISVTQTRPNKGGEQA